MKRLAYNTGFERRYSRRKPDYVPPDGWEAFFIGKMAYIDNSEAIEKKLSLGDVIIVNEIGFKLSTSLFIKLANFLKNGYRDRGWTHSALYIGDGNIIEAFPTGIVVRSFKDAYLQGTHNFLILRHKNCSREKLEQVVKYCLSEKGKKYDTRGIIYFLVLNLIPRQLHFILKINSWAEKFNEKDKFFCSELVSKGYQEGGLYCFEEESYKIMPADFNNRLLFDLIHMEKKIKGSKIWRSIKDCVFGVIYFFIAFGIYSLVVWLVLLIQKFFIGIALFILSAIGLLVISLVQTIKKKQAIEATYANRLDTPKTGVVNAKSA